MPDEDVIEVEEEQSVETEETPDEPKEAKVTAKELSKQNELLKSELDLQAKRFERLERQVEAQRNEKPKAKEPEEESEFDYDLLEGVTNNDRKGFSKAIRAEIKKAGYIRADEVDALVQQRAGEYSAQQQILIDHPELNDKKSAMYKQTEQELTEINGDGEFSRLSDAKKVQLAAQRAELALYRNGKAPDDSERQARIKNQSGVIGGRKTTESSELSAEQTRISLALGVDPKKYAARAAKGINFSRGEKK